MSKRRSPSRCTVVKCSCMSLLPNAEVVIQVPTPAYKNRNHTSLGVTVHSRPVRQWILLRQTPCCMTKSQGQLKLVASQVQKSGRLRQDQLVTVISAHIDRQTYCLYALHALMPCKHVTLHHACSMTIHC